MLTIYRRHKTSCDHRAEGWAYRRCHCPMWVKGAIGTEKIWCSLGTTDWAKAQNQVRDWEAAGQLPLRREEDEPLTVEQACEQIIADAKARNLRPDTISKYKLLSTQLQKFATERNLATFADFTLGELSTFRAGWKDKNLGALKKLERLRGFFRFAEDHDWIKVNPAKKLKSPRVKAAPTLPFTKTEMERILKAATERVAFSDMRQAGMTDKARANSRRLRGLILLLRYSGLRIGDAVSCEVDRLVGGKLRLYTEKGGTHVHLPLPLFVIKELDCIPRASERYWFWSAESKLHSLKTKWDELLRKVFDKAGLPDGHAHRFRDTFAVDLLMSGVPLERVSILLGHRSVRVTEKHYSPWIRERQEQAESDVRRSWVDDPLYIMETKAMEDGTKPVYGKPEPVN